jgi:hypothetical protein
MVAMRRQGMRCWAAPAKWDPSMRSPAIALASLFAASGALGAVTPQQAAALRGPLTPVGAERAGNAAGTIPPWTGGMVTEPARAGSASGGTIVPDPYGHEPPGLIIERSNVAQYKAHLPEGALAMFARYPDYKMRVFPTHRTAALPQPVYDAIARNAVSAHAAPSGIAYGVAEAAGGVPFPIPANGAEVVWNHLLAFWGAAREDHVSTFVAPGDGTIEQTAGYREMTDFPFYAPGAKPGSVGAYYFKTRRIQQAPPSRVGEGYIAWQPLDVAADRFVAWRYLPGEHRSRKAPSLSYDTPDPDTSGYESLDEYYLFFGGQDRYAFRLLGKRELYIPYNNNRLAWVPAREAMTPAHANQDLMRYELHRVWVVEGTLAQGKHDIVARRRLYMDEDTWLAVYSEEWDEDGRLWKFGHATMMLLPDVPAVIGGSRFTYDLVNGGYCYDFVLSPPGWYRVTGMHSADIFSPDALAADSLR